jgi:hypothetical protein
VRYPLQARVHVRGQDPGVRCTLQARVYVRGQDPRMRLCRHECMSAVGSGRSALFGTAYSAGAPRMRSVHALEANDRHHSQGATQRAGQYGMAPQSARLLGPTSLSGGNIPDRRERIRAGSFWNGGLPGKAGGPDAPHVILDVIQHASCRTTEQSICSAQASISAPGSGTRAD